MLFVRADRLESTHGKAKSTLYTLDITYKVRNGLLIMLCWTCASPQRVNKPNCQARTNSFQFVWISVFRIWNSTLTNLIVVDWIRPNSTKMINKIGSWNSNLMSKFGFDYELWMGNFRFNFVLGRIYIEIRPSLQIMSRSRSYQTFFLCKQRIFRFLLTS